MAVSEARRKRVGTEARLAGWLAMRNTVPREQWSTELCDAIAEAAVDATLQYLQRWDDQHTTNEERDEPHIP